MSSKLSKLFILQVPNAAADMLAWSFFPLYAFKFGLDYHQIIFSYMLMYIFGVAFIALYPRYGRRGNMGLGLVIKGISVLLLGLSVNEYMFYLSGVVNGMSLRFFWVPYNAYFMEAVKGNKRAESSGKLFFLLAACGAAVPLAGGWIISLSSYRFLFALSFFCFLAGALYANFKVESKPFEVTLWAGDARRLAFLILEGIWQGAFWISVPLATIFFLKKEMDFGIFMAFLGASGGLASIMVGRYSDLRMDRRKPLAVSAGFAFVFSLAAALTTTKFILWSALIGLAYFFIYIMYSFTFTYSREACESSYTAMATRELFLNSGRVLGASVLLGSLWVTDNLIFGFLVGSISLLFIAVFASKLKVPLSEGENIEVRYPYPPNRS